jgi:hypothetical protein
MLVSKASDCRTKLNPCSAEVKVRGEHVSASVLLYRFDCLAVAARQVSERLGDGTHYMRRA